VITVTARAIQAAVELNATGSFAAASRAELVSEIEGIVAATPAGIGDFVSSGSPVLELQKSASQLRLQEAEAREREAKGLLAQAEARLRPGYSGPLERTPEVESAGAAIAAVEAEEQLLRLEAARAERLPATGELARGVFERARANLAMALARTAGLHRQFDTLLNQGRMAAAALDQARAGPQAARVQTAFARKGLEDTTIRAPFSGYVSARNISAGEFVNNQARVLTLDRFAPLKLEIQGPESELARLKPGLMVQASVQAWPGESFTGSISALSPAVNPASRSFLVEAQFPNADRRLKPGMFATVRIELGPSEARSVIPAEALEQDVLTRDPQSECECAKRLDAQRGFAAQLSFRFDQSDEYGAVRRAGHGADGSELWRDYEHAE